MVHVEGPINGDNEKFKISPALFTSKLTSGVPFQVPCFGIIFSPLNPMLVKSKKQIGHKIIHDK